MSNFNFSLAYEMVMMELCAIAEKEGKTAEDVKNFCSANPEIIAERMKEITK